MREKLLQKHLLCKKGRKAKLAKLLWMNLHSCTQQEMLILKEPKINNLNSVRLPGPSSPFWKWTKHSSPILLRVMGTWDNLLSKSAKELVRSQNWSEGKISRSHQAFIYSQGTWGITTSLLSRTVIPHTPFILAVVASQQIWEVEWSKQQFASTSLCYISLFLGSC